MKEIIRNLLHIAKENDEQLIKLNMHDIKEYFNESFNEEYCIYYRSPLREDSKYSGFIVLNDNSEVVKEILHKSNYFGVCNLLVFGKDINGLISIRKPLVYEFLNTDDEI